MLQFFRIADEATAYQVAEYNNGSGHFGWLGGLNDPTKLYTAYYSQGVSLAVYQTFYPLYSLNLTGSLSGDTAKTQSSLANVSLSKFAAAALESLPPTYNVNTSAVFDLFIDTFGLFLQYAVVAVGLVRCAWSCE